MKRFWYAWTGQPASWVRARSKADAIRTIRHKHELFRNPSGLKVWN